MGLLVFVGLDCVQHGPASRSFIFMLMTLALTRKRSWKATSCPAWQLNFDSELAPLQFQWPHHCTRCLRTAIIHILISMIHVYSLSCWIAIQVVVLLKIIMDINKRLMIWFSILVNWFDAQVLFMLRFTGPLYKFALQVDTLNAFTLGQP